MGWVGGGGGGCWWIEGAWAGLEDWGIEGERVEGWIR